MVQLSVKHIISSTVAISPTAGLLAFEAVKSQILKGEHCHVSFDGIENLTSAFCNAFIGKLYMRFGEKVVDNLVKVTDFESNEVWAEKIRTAKILGIDENFRKADQENISQLFA
jgi:hypothetical protein